MSKPTPNRLSRLLQALVRHQRLLTWLVLAIMAGLVIADLIIPAAYQRYPWDGIGGFGALYGLASCILIIVVSKALGYAFLYKPENYYEDEPSDD